jgi:predicted  nucleic acid-binding Zn-ribbon protein
MDPVVVVLGLIILVGAGAGIPAFTILKLARLKAAQAASPSAEVTGRLEALESDVQSLQQELAETQERLDFAERLLTKAREERRIGP